MSALAARRPAAIRTASGMATRRAITSRRRSMPRGGLPSKRIIVGYGFWIFLLSDIIMFSAFFATYAVLVGRDRRRARAGTSCSTCSNVAIETACLLLSSFTCGLASIGAQRAQRHRGSTARWR